MSLFKRFFVAFLFLCSCSTAQTQEWIGSPFVDHFEPKIYNAQPQNFSVAEDDRDILYFANNDGVLVFDGEYWKLIYSESQMPVYSLFKSSAGRMYYGSVDELGVISSDSLGNLKAEALFLDERYESGRFHHIFEFQDQICFLGRYTGVFLKSGKQDTLQFKDECVGSFGLGEELYIQFKKDGLMKLIGGKLIPQQIPGLSSEELILQNIQDEGRSINYLIGMNGIWVEDGAWVKRIYSDVDELLSENGLLDAILDRNGNLLISVDNHGLFRLSPEGRLIEVIGRANGLPDITINSLLIDVFGSIWAASNNGISRVNSKLGIKKFGGIDGLHGAVEDICFIENGTALGTHEGVFIIDFSQNRRTQIVRQLRISIQKIEDLNQECWKVIPHPKKKKNLICAMNDGLYEVDLKTSSSRLVHECYPWTCMYDSLNDIILLGLDPGVQILDPASMEVLADIEGVEAPIRKIVGDGKGTYWLGSIADAFYRLTIGEVTAEGVKYELLALWGNLKFESSVVEPVFFGDSLLLGTNYGLSYFDQIKQESTKLLQDSLLDSLYIHRLISDGHGTMWLSTANDDNRIRTGKWSAKGGFQYNMFEPISDAIVRCLEVDQQGRVWVGNANGLYVFNEQDFEVSNIFNTHIRRVRLNQKEVLFNGGYERPKPVLNFNQNDLEFSFSSFRVMDGTPHNYSYRLKGLEESWSDWNKISEARFNNIPPGNYVFMAKSKNMYEAESKIASFAFSISPPWYETGWYYLAQALVFLILIGLTLYFSRGSANRYSEALILITIITLFEFVILAIEPYVDNYANGVPLFKLGMNIILALSLNPMERFLRNLFKKRTTQNPA